jgi:hypothetical protein
MRNLRKIFESLGFFKRSPVLTIKDMAARVNTAVNALQTIMTASNKDERDAAVTLLMSVSNATPDDLILFNRIMDAVIAIAEDEKAGKKATAATED